MLIDKEFIMEISDILIHVDEVLDNDRRFLLEEALLHTRGVVSPRVSSQRSHLMFVAYDADSTSAAEVLVQVHDQGYAAQIVGI